MADSPQTDAQDSPSPPPREPITGFISGQGWSISTLGSTLKIEMGTEATGRRNDQGSGHYFSAEPAFTVQVSTPTEVAQLLTFMAALGQFMNHFYPPKV